MQSRSSEPHLALVEPQVLHEVEVPDPVSPPAMTQMVDLATMTPTIAPTPEKPSRIAPSLLPVFQALSMVLAARLQALLLLISAIALGFLTVNDPAPLRLVAGAGYGIFCLAALWVLPKR